MIYLKAFIAKALMKAFADTPSEIFVDLIVPWYRLASFCRRILIPIVLPPCRMRTAPSASIFLISSRRFTPTQARSADECSESLLKTNLCRDRADALLDPEARFLASCNRDTDPNIQATSFHLANT
jgi:hypothetical protein